MLEIFLSQPGMSLDNQQLMTALFDAVESHPLSQATHYDSRHSCMYDLASKSFLRNGGKYSVLYYMHPGTFTARCLKQL